EVGAGRVVVLEVDAAVRIWRKASQTSNLGPRKASEPAVERLIGGREGQGSNREHSLVGLAQVIGEAHRAEWPGGLGNNCRHRSRGIDQRGSVGGCDRNGSACSGWTGLA